MKNTFIAFDGLDGSGKTTQTELLISRLAAAGIPYRYISFPTYDDRFSFFVNEYLGGRFGSDPNAVNAYAASSFFSADRYLSYITDWKADYDSGKVIIANRYTTANAVHQCSKLPRSEWDGFLEWLFDYEWNRLGLPRPDKVIYLCQPPEVSIQLINRRCEETGAKPDIHEQSPRHLRSSYEAALYVSDKYGWDRINVYDGASIRSIEDIGAEVLSRTGELISL